MADTFAPVWDEIGRALGQAWREINETPREGLVTLVPSSGSKLTLLMAGDPDHTVPVGGWEASGRVGRPPVRWWKAPGDGSLQLDLAIDVRLVGGPAMARRLQVLAAMGERPEHGDTPPTITIIGGHLPLARGGWVMQGLTLGARVVQEGEHLRQAVNVSLEPHTPQPAFEPVRPGRTRASLTSKRRRREIRSLAGDTLRAIALRQLGSAGQWRDIRAWNPALKNADPDAVLRTGTRVILR